MEHLNLHHLYLFWVFSKTNSFTKTAERLSIAQSAVTIQIRQLEDLLGMTLVDRSNRKNPELTSEGKEVLEFADSIFESTQELLQWAKKSEGPKQKILKIGALSGLSRNLQYEFLQPALAEKNVKLEVVTGDQEKLVRLLKEHALDVILSSHNVRAEGKVQFYSHVLTSSPLVLVKKKERSKKELDWRDMLKKGPVFLPGRSFEARPELDAQLEKLKISISNASEIEDIALLRVFAVRSGALVLLPKMGVKNEIESQEVQVLQEWKEIQQRFYAITRQKKVPSRLIQELIESLQSKK